MRLNEMGVVDCITCARRTGNEWTEYVPKYSDRSRPDHCSAKLHTGRLTIDGRREKRIRRRYPPTLSTGRRFRPRRMASISTRLSSSGRLIWSKNTAGLPFHARSTTIVATGCGCRYRRGHGNGK